MSSVVSVSDPNDLDVSMEMAKPEEEWMDIQSWTLCGYSALDDRRAEFDRFESALYKVASDLGFDQSMAAMRQKMFCVPLLTLLKIARATPSPTLEDRYCSLRSFLN